MNWSDEGIILSIRAHGETAAIAEIFTRSHGRHLGLVHGGRSRRLRPVLQIGNHVDATWKGRLAEHLGHISVELQRGFAGEAMAHAPALAGLNALTTLLRQLPDRGTPSSGKARGQRDLCLRHLLRSHRRPAERFRA